MACYHPLFAYRERRSEDKQFHHFQNYEYDEITIRNHPELEFTQIPCGKCIGCRLEYSRQWAMRCMLEAQDHQNNEFITLTYDEEHVPKGHPIDKETGEVLIEENVNTLRFKDLQDFMKRLRIQFKRELGIENVRFYACGEYGSNKWWTDKNGIEHQRTQRPHFHIICFNCPLPDKKLEKSSRKGSVQYSSKFLEKLWPFGIVRTSPVTFESCAYVARYMMKKQKGKEAVEEFELTGRNIENVRMSRRPGIGKKYFNEHKNKIYETDEIWLKNKFGSMPLKPPKYYDKLFDVEEHETMEKIKEKRKQLAERIDKSAERQTGKTKLERLKEKEDYKLQAIQRLKRTI